MNKQLIEMRKRPHWSFSSLNGFLNICSLKWAFGHYYDTEEVKEFNELGRKIILRLEIWSG